MGRLYRLIIAAIILSFGGQSLAQNPLEAAYQAYIKMDFDGARSILEPLTLQESNPILLTRAYKLLGIVAYMQGKMDLAATSFKKALELDPGTMISKSEVLEESIIAYFKKIASMNMVKVKQNKKPKKTYKIIVRKRNLYPREKWVAALPFGSGQFMHKQNLLGASSAILQVSALAYGVSLFSDIRKSQRHQDEVQDSNKVGVFAKQIYAEAQGSYRDRKQEKINLAIGAFFSLWAISSVDAYLTPKYKRVRKRIRGQSSKKPGKDSYSSNFALQYQSTQDSKDGLQLAYRFNF